MHEATDVRALAVARTSVESITSYEWGYKIPTFIKSAYLSSHYSYPAQDVVEVGHDHQEQEDAETDIFGIYHEVV